MIHCVQKYWDATVGNQSSHVGAVSKQSDNIIRRHTPSVHIFMTGRSFVG